MGDDTVVALLTLAQELKLLLVRELVLNLVHQPVHGLGIFFLVYLKFDGVDAVHQILVDDFDLRERQSVFLLLSNIRSFFGFFQGVAN